MSYGIGPGQRNLGQPITYWAVAGRTPDNEVNFAAPVLLVGRWSEKNNLVRNIKGDEVVTHAQVELSADVEENGFLALGDYSSTGQNIAIPHDVPGAQEITAFQATPDLRFMEQQRIAYVG